MVNLLYCSPSIVDSISFYRGWGPLTALCNIWPNLNIEYCTEVNWSTLKKAHIVYVQRPSISNYVKIIEMAKLNGKKVWIDYDDDLFSIPQDNPNFINHNKEDTNQHIINSLRMADLVTVSTKQLKQVYEEFNRNLHVVPNAYDKNLFSYRKKELPKRTGTIFWRGSATHDNDLFEVTPALIKVAEKYSEMTWVFIGTPFWHTIKELQKNPKLKIIQIPVMDPIYYFKTIYEMNPFLQIVPLSDNIFNKAKSNIAWIEGTHAGAGVLAPHFEEWQKPGIFNYQGVDDFENLLTMIIEIKRTTKNVEASEEYIEEHLLMDKINLKRKELIESIL